MVFLIIVPDRFLCLCSKREKEYAFAPPDSRGTDGPVNNFIRHRCIVKTILVTLSIFLALGLRSRAEVSEDSYVTRNGSTWTLGSSAVEMSIALQNGMLITTHYENKANGHDLSSSDATGPWTLSDSKISKLKQGELQLDLTLRKDSLQVTRSYVVYPGSSIIREWAEFKNVGSAPIKIVDPEFLAASIHPGDPSSVDFDWMTGGENDHSSWTLKTEKLSAGRPRRFDSYDPFPVRGVCGDFVDDRPNDTVLLNDKQIWPAPGQTVVQNVRRAFPIDASAEIQKGDRIVFLVAPNRAFEDLDFDPTITFSDGETHIGSKEFSTHQGGNGWEYRFADKERAGDLVFDDGVHAWRLKMGAELGPFISAGVQRGGLTEDAARLWTANKAGMVRVSGDICSGPLAADGKPGFRAGSASYAPWVALYDHSSKDGMFLGWDYFGHWASSYTLDQHGSVQAELHVAGYKRDLQPGETITTPKAFLGLFQGDLDDAGNTLLDWQYQYLWDYTRDGWFPGIRMLGDWWKGTSWGLPEGSWTGGGGDNRSTFLKVFRLADMMREVGADVYHRDWGWWDRAGDWNGPDFRTIQRNHYFHQSEGRDGGLHI